MTHRIQHFLLVFDHGAGRLIQTEPFGEDAERALTVYGSTEEQYADRADIEVVLVGSDSLETIKRTHANYFDGPAPASRYLAGI